MVTLAYHEAKLNTRKRNLIGYALFFLGTLMLIVVSNAYVHTLFLRPFLLHVLNFIFTFVIGGFSYVWEWSNWTLYWYMCMCWCIWGCRCPCSRWNGRRPVFYASWIHPGWSSSQSSSMLETTFVIVCNINLTVSYLSECCFYVLLLQSFFAGLAASGALTSGMRLMTKAAFEKYHNGLRKGASMWIFFTNRQIGGWFSYTCCCIVVKSVKAENVDLRYIEVTFQVLYLISCFLKLESYFLIDFKYFDQWQFVVWLVFCSDVPCNFHTHRVSVYSSICNLLP